MFKGIAGIGVNKVLGVYAQSLITRLDKNNIYFNILIVTQWFRHAIKEHLTSKMFWLRG